MKILRYVLIAIFVASVTIPVFSRLGAMSIRDWDESRLALNAVEMIKTGNPVVTYCMGEPDMWNTKPPLMIWLQAICLKIFGYNEFAIRFPSAMAVVFTIFLFIYFSRKILDNELFGFLASLILVCFNGYLNTHIARTGDYDALLTLFTTLYTLSFFTYIESGNKKKYLYITALGILFAVLTKGVTGLFFLPFLFIYVFFRKQAKTVFTNKHTYIAVFLFLAISIGYYFLRESFNPGYLKAVYNNELGGRFAGTVEQHEQGFWYYLVTFKEWRLTGWLYFIPLSVLLLVAGYFEQNKKLRRFITYATFVSLGFFLVISASKTKILWYDAPLFPMFALICAFPVLIFTDKIFHNEKIKSVTLKYTLTFFALLIVFFPTYSDTINKIFYTDDNQWRQLQYGYYMKKLPDKKSYYVCHEGYNGHVEFYKEVFNRKGYNIKSKAPANLVTGDIAMVCENAVMDTIKAKLNFELIDSWNGNSLIKIVADKKEAAKKEAFENNPQVEQIISNIRNTPEWLKAIEQKANEKGISLDDMLKEDAIFIFEQEKNKK